MDEHPKPTTNGIQRNLYARVAVLFSVNCRGLESTTLKNLRLLLSLTNQSVSYGVGIFLRQFISIASIALFAHSLPQAEYGILAITTSVLTLAQNVTAPGIIPTVFRLYHDAKTPQEKRYILGASQINYIGYMLVISGLIWIFAEPLAVTFLKSADYVNVVKMLAFLLLTEGPYTLCHAFLRIQERPMASSMQSIFHISLRVGISLLFVYQFNMGVEGYWIGQVIGSLLGFTVLLWLVRDMLTFKTNWASLKRVFSYAAAFIPQVIASWVNREFDNFLIVSIVGLSAVAVYDIGYRIGQVVLLAVTPITYAWPQFIYSRLDMPNAKELQRDALTFVTLFVAFVAVLLFAIAPYTLEILAPEGYAAAMSVILWSTLAHAFNALNAPYALGIQVVKKPRYIAMIVFISGVLNIVLNLFFIPLMGIVGAAIVTFISYSFATIAALVVGQRLHPVPVNWWKFIRLGIVTLGCILTIHWINLQEFSTLYDLLLRGAVILVFVGLLFVIRLFTPSQIRLIASTTYQVVRERRKLKTAKQNNRVAIESATSDTSGVSQ